MEIVLSSRVYSDGCRVIYRKGQNSFILPNDVLTINECIKYNPSVLHYKQYTRNRFTYTVFIDAYNAICTDRKVAEMWKLRNSRWINRQADRRIDRNSFPG